MVTTLKTCECKSCSEVIKSHQDDANGVEVSLFLNAGKVPCVRIMDTDSGDVLAITRCMDMAQAESKFAYYVNTL